MNPDRIYREHRDDALAEQVVAPAYATFVAMPLRERHSYRPDRVFDSVIRAAGARASEINGGKPRPFAPPERVSDRAGVAAVITEDIVEKILKAHFFVADLTLENPGVVLETGIALGLKSNNQIVLLLDGDPQSLHFDIRNNRVIRYDRGDPVEDLAKAFLEAARSFESDRPAYVEFVKRNLTPAAILYLNCYGRLQREQPGASLHEEAIAELLDQEPIDLSPAFSSPFGGDMPNEIIARRILDMDFSSVARELISRRLLYTDYKAGAIEGGDQYGLHATEVGWLVIEGIWDDLRRQPPSDSHENPPST